MRRNHREGLKTLAKQLEISAYVPPDSAQRIAEERTEDMVTYFQRLRMNCGWSEESRYLQLLANSCYLQGVGDAAAAMAKMGGSLVGRKDEK